MTYFGYLLIRSSIGQKLSERVESFHFTHSINAFRRQINVELGTGAIRTYLRDDLGGIMVLPVGLKSVAGHVISGTDQFCRSTGAQH